MAWSDDLFDSALKAANDYVKSDLDNKATARTQTLLRTMQDAKAPVPNVGATVDGEMPPADGNKKWLWVGLGVVAVVGLLLVATRPAK